MAFAHLIVKEGDLHSILIGTIQTSSYNNEQKWLSFSQLITEIETQYQKPKIIHVDINV